jgi:succinate dehydrogenase / fumarate reductase membrane anchor subunit
MMEHQGQMRSPLGRAVGLGSAKEGADHWWGQRLSALALVPLSLWFVASLISLAGADYETFTQWVASPLVAVLLILTIVATFYHTLLGLQVVIEDYVHAEGARLALLVLLRFLCYALGLAAVFAVLRIALGG